MVSGHGSIGQGLLKAAEASASQQGCSTLFALTTQTTEWFKEKGFIEAGVDSLPEAKQIL